MADFTDDMNRELDKYRSLSANSAAGKLNIFLSTVVILFVVVGGSFVTRSIMLADGSFWTALFTVAMGVGLIMVVYKFWLSPAIDNVLLFRKYKRDTT